VVAHHIASRGGKVKGRSNTREIALKPTSIPMGRSLLTIEDGLRRVLTIAVVASEPPPDDAGLFRSRVDQGYG
jgi:hypothetical protein